MKKIIPKEVSFCDKCSKEIPQHYNYSCDNCELEVCRECSDTIVRFQQGLYISGGSDACYCPKCITALTESGDKRLAAFRGIASLKRDADAYNKAFEQRRLAAEELVKQFPRKEKA